MNRLIIIGNGFDLAHGLRTNYNDFLDWVWYNKLDTSRYAADYDIINRETTCYIENNLIYHSYQMIEYSANL